MNTCPNCGNHGKSLGAIALTESNNIDMNGGFGGVGIGLDGDLGVMGGVSSMSGTQETKRAQVFAMPRKRYTGKDSKMPFVIALGAITAIIVFNPFGVMSGSDGRYKELAESMQTYAPLGFLFVLFQFFKSSSERYETASDKIANEAMEARYNNIFHCDRCNVLYDKNGMTTTANGDGFSKMMTWR